MRSSRNSARFLALFPTISVRIFSYSDTGRYASSVIKSVLKLASGSHVGASLDNASRVDPESFAKRIGIETGGYVKEE